MSATEPTQGAPIDDAVWVREQLASLAGPLVLDGAAFVGPSVAAGHAARRRRRWQHGIAGAAALAVVAAGCVVGLRATVYRDNATPPATGAYQLVPATPRGLAAAVIADLPSGVHVTTAGGAAATVPARELSAGAPGATTPPGTVRVIEADLVLSGGVASSRLAVGAAPHWVVEQISQGFGSCPQSSARTKGLSCVTRRLPGGSRLILLSVRPNPGSAHHTEQQLVVLIGARRSVAIAEITHSAQGVPEPLVSMSGLEDMVRDPLVGLQTSPGMVRAGAHLQGFRHSDWLFGVSSTVSGSATSTFSPPKPLKQRTPRTASLHSSH